MPCSHFYLALLSLKVYTILVHILRLFALQISEEECRLKKDEEKQKKCGKESASMRDIGK